MTEPLVHVHMTPELHEPILVVALEGWIDAGLGAANAMSELVSATGAEPVAEFDSDRLLDHRARRPIMHLVNGLITGLTWPSIEVRAGSDDAGNDVLLLLGAEPDFEWQAFSRAVVDLAHGYGARMVVALGRTPHPSRTPVAPACRSRPPRPTSPTPCTATSADTLDVPGGIHSVLDVAANEAGIPALGLWAQVPHYVASMPYPAASVALLEGLGEVAGLALEPGQLPSDAKATRIRLDELVAENPQHQTMVTQLEEMMDQGLGGPDDAPTFGFDDLPSGDELAEELQEFLRDRPEEG